jgi:regulation of enolase protein 1 (concanavalin A-like superfamily)
VFEYPDPSSGYKYGMFFMVNYADDIRHISAAFSRDGRTWDVQPQPIVDPGDAEGANVSGADLWEWNGQLYVIYGSTVGTIFARTIDPQLSETGDPEPLFIPQPAPPEAGRAASPQIITVDGQTHMFYEYGDRSHTTIGHAILDPDAARDPLNKHPEDPMYEKCQAPGSDEFDGEALNQSLWTNIVRGDLARQAVADGSLNVPTYTGNSTSSPLILQDVPAAPWEMTTKLSIDPQKNFQQAGVILYQNDANSARVDLSHVDEGQRIDFVWRHNNVDRNDKWTMEDAVMAPESMGDSIWLRMTDHGDYLTASYSVDGQTFVNLGRNIPMDQLEPIGIGPFAYRGSASVPEITASFDWIRFSPSDEQLAECEAAGGEVPGGPGEDHGDQGDGNGDGGSQVAVVELGASVVAPGDALALHGSGFGAGESVDVSLHSAPVKLATLAADAAGRVSGSVTIPGSAVPGAHAIVLAGSVSGLSASAPLTIRAIDSGRDDPASTSLASTGTDLAGTLAVTVIVLFVGLGALIVVAKRRRATR